MKTEKAIQSEINEIKLSLKAKEEVWREFPAKNQLEMDVRNHEANNLKQRMYALEWVVSP